MSRDPVNDVAIIKIQADKLPPVKLGDATKLELGQSVIAIGNALGNFQKHGFFGNRLRDSRGRFPRKQTRMRRRRKCAASSKPTPPSIREIPADRSWI